MPPNITPEVVPPYRIPIPDMSLELELLSDIAKKIGWSEVQIRRAIRSGKVLAHKRGRFYITTEAAVRAYLDNDPSRKYDPMKRLNSYKVLNDQEL